MDKFNGQYQKLPPGWDCKYDQATGNCYYINYFTKAIQLEDPRMRYKQLQNERSSTESIPLQPLHGSPYHVYPSNNMPALRAFQTGPGTTQPSLQNMSASPLLSSRGNLEMSPLPYGRTSVLQTPRLANMSRRSTIQETSFSNQFDTDGVVAKIQNMFPTAGENHIRLLLKKYYNREAVVISALQVEKHPVTMPGPYVTPPAQRHLYHSNSVFYMTPPSRRLDIGAGSRSGLGSSTSRTASPVPGGRFGSVMSMHSGFGGVVAGGGIHVGDSGEGYGPAAMPFHGSPRFGNQWRSSPKPHSSPKMKLRYMKNIFPKADEMLLLDILAGADNNVQQASEKLISMGYQKRDFMAPKVSHRFNAEAQVAQKRLDDEKIIALRPKEYTQQQKETMRLHLKEKYPQIAERIIVMALESVNFAEDRAMQILQIVQEEDEERAKKHAVALAATARHMTTAADIGDGAADVHTGTDVADNILTIVLEAMPNSDIHMGTTATATPTTTATTKAAKKRTLPSINLTTPTTATTQIILSSPSICIENESPPGGAAALSSSTTTTTQTKEAFSTEDASAEWTPTAAAEKTAPSNGTHLNAFSETSDSSSSTSSTPFSPSSSAQPSFQRITTKDILSRCSRAKSIEIGVGGYLHGSISKSNSCSASLLDTLKLPPSRDKSDSLKNSQRDSTEEEVNRLQQYEFKSLLGRMAAMGHNAELVKGPDENLLLADYVTWNGANPDITLGHKQLAVGPDPSNLSERSYTSLGLNPDLYKGPKVGLAKGSIYAQLSAVGSGKNTNIKCN